MSEDNLYWVIADYADAVSAMGEEIRSLKMDKARLTAALAAAEERNQELERAILDERQWHNKHATSLTNQLNALDLKSVELEAHNGVLRGIVEMLLHQSPELPEGFHKQARDALYAPAVGSLDRIRREGAEAAAKVCEADAAKSRECYANSRQTDDDRKLVNACTNTAAAIAQAIRALYPEVAPQASPGTDAGLRLTWVDVGGGAHMAAPDNNVEWSLRYGSPEHVRYVAATILNSYEYLVMHCTKDEAWRRIKLIRAAKAGQHPRDSGPQSTHPKGEE